MVKHKTLCEIFILTYSFFFWIFSTSTRFVSLEDAVKIALENNYDIKIAKNNSKIDATNNNLANAGMLPSLNANFTNNNSQLNTTQTQADGSERKLDNA